MQSSEVQIAAQAGSILRATAGSRFTEVDEVLAECHWLAWDAMKPDTS